MYLGLSSKSIKDILDGSWKTINEVLVTWLRKSRGWYCVYGIKKN